MVHLEVDPDVGLMASLPPGSRGKRLPFLLGSLDEVFCDLQGGWPVSATPSFSPAHTVSDHLISENCRPLLALPSSFGLIFFSFLWACVWEQRKSSFSEKVAVAETVNHIQSA